MDKRKGEETDVEVKRTKLEEDRRKQEYLKIKKEYKLEDIEEPKPVGKPEKVEDKKKKRGQNKPKDRQSRGVDDGVRLCHAAANGEKCTKEVCKFSHDIQEYLASKEPDLGDTCPVYERFGVCKYGVKCRFANAHLVNGVGISKELVVDEHEIYKNDVSKTTLKNIRTGAIDYSQSSDFIAQTKAAKEAAEQHDPESADSKHSEKLDKFDEDTKEVRLRPQEKKKVNFKGKTYLAPLTTVGNLPFRKICKDFGVDITCAEMALTSNLLLGNNHEWGLMRRHASEDFFGIQVTANHHEPFTKVCDAINQVLDIDFLDINLGCPVESICSRGNGSALMNRKDKMRGMIQGANYVMDCPITVKCRTGLKDKSPFAHKLVPNFQQWGAAALTLHGRSKEQRYSRLADWEYINKCGGLIDKTVENPMAFFGNGDIFNPEDLTRVYDDCPNVDGIMVGRGALIKPWIFKELKTGQLWDISATERLDILKEYANVGMEYWGSDTMASNI
ncbi:tRNA-dihydrouridine(47) synthase [NAD(P)(+)]-like protein [Boothiomyces sp. JEL0866]|nr:tRNA-dihydrouridine(47) synthase [NAD(P)(+)]-like protein [Boothiomyces sp. JEL0866]